MIRRVRWTRAATDELLGIVRYIAGDNPRAARRVGSTIRQTGNDLGNAAIGRPGRVLETYERVVRGLPYIIAYALQPSEDGNERVIILHVIHTARNWPEGKWPT